MEMTLLTKNGYDMDTTTKNSNKKYWWILLIPGFFFVTVLLFLLLPYIIFNLDVSRVVHLTIHKNNHTYTVEEVSGGATVGYYIVLKVDKENVYQQRALAPVDIESVIIKNDSIYIYFRDPLNLPIQYQLIE